MEAAEYITYHPNSHGRFEHFFIYSSAEQRRDELERLMSTSPAYVLIDGLGNLDSRVLQFKALLDAATDLRADGANGASTPFGAKYVHNTTSGGRHWSVMYVIYEKID